MHLHPMQGSLEQEMLEQLITSLPLSYRSVFMLRAVEGLSIDETAEYLGITAATAMTRSRGARLLVRERLGKQIDVGTADPFAFRGTRCDDLIHRVLVRLCQPS